MNQEFKFRATREYRGLGPVAGATHNGIMMISGTNGAGKTRLLQEIEAGWRRLKYQPAQEEESSCIRWEPEIEWVESTAIERTPDPWQGEGTNEWQLWQALEERRGGGSARHGREENKSELERVARAIGTTYDTVTGENVTEWLRKEYEREAETRWTTSVKGWINSHYKARAQAAITRLFKAAKENKTLMLREEMSRDGPYEEVNEVLRRAGSRHVIVKRPMEEWFEQVRDNERYDPEVEVEEVGGNGPKVRTGDLSTGESKLLWLAGCLAKRERIGGSEGKLLLLLDEFDTGLHPAMKIQYVKTLRELARRGVYVLTTTHDPITVGMADEGWVRTLTSEWRNNKRRSELEVTSRRMCIQMMLGVREVPGMYADRDEGDEVSEEVRKAYAKIADACVEMGHEG